MCLSPVLENQPPKCCLSKIELLNAFNKWQVDGPRRPGEDKNNHASTSRFAHVTANKLRHRIQDSSAPRTCSEFVSLRAVTPHKHRICQDIFGRTPVAFAGYTSETLPGFTYVWYYNGANVVHFVGHASVRFQRTNQPHIARKTRTVTRKAKTSARIIVLRNRTMIVIICKRRGVNIW